MAEIVVIVIGLWVFYNWHQNKSPSKGKKQTWPNDAWENGGRVLDLNERIHDLREKFYRQYGATEKEFDVAYLSAYIMNDQAEEISERIYNEAHVERVHQKMIALGILAQNLKIPEKAVVWGFRTSAKLNYTWEDGLQDEYKFFIWYDAELRRCGFPYMLLFVKRDAPDHSSLDFTNFFRLGNLEYGHWVGDPEFQREYESSDHMLGDYCWIPQWQQVPYIPPVEAINGDIINKAIDKQSERQIQIFEDNGFYVLDPREIS